MFNARRLGALEHIRQIRGKAFVVQMGMGIDEHESFVAEAAGFGHRP
jgi:hypothetical protein